MAKFIETRFGKIPTNELKLADFPDSPELLLSTYFDKKLTKSLIVGESNSSLLFKVRGRITRLPKFLSPKLAYFVGYFFGDGGMKDLKKSFINYKKLDHKFKIADEFKIQIELIQKLYKQLFWLGIPIREERIEKGENTYYLESTNLVVYRFLCNSFGLSGGTKNFSLMIPQIIKESPKETKKYFLRGLFDADGDTRAIEQGFRSQSRIKLRMNQKQFIVEIKKLLEEVFNISVNGPYFDPIKSSYIQIERQADIVKLFEHNFFLHPIKRWRLNKTAHFLKNKKSLKAFLVESN